MGPRSALCAATAATDRQDELTAGAGGEVRAWGKLGGVWGPVSHPAQSQSTPLRGGQQAGRDWIGAGRAALGLDHNQSCLVPESHRPRARPVDRLPRLGKWAGGQVGTGQEAPAATGGSSSSGVQLETWARGGGRLGRQLGGPAEGCTSPPFFCPLSRIRLQKLYRLTKQALLPSEQKPSRTLATHGKRGQTSASPWCQRQGRDETNWMSLPSRQAHRGREARIANNGWMVSQNA